MVRYNRTQPDHVRHAGSYRLEIRLQEAPMLGKVCHRNLGRSRNEPSETTNQ